MAFCPNCGTKIDDGAAFCPNCGSKIGGAAAEAPKAAESPKAEAPKAEAGNEDFSKKVAALNDTPDTTADYEENDISSNRVMAILCYIGILWLVPYLCCKDSKFVKFHLGQGLWAAIFSVAATIFSGVPVLNLVTWLATVILSVIGIVNVINGRAKELPVVGKNSLLK